MKVDSRKFSVYYSPPGSSAVSGAVKKAVWESRQEDVDVGGGAEGGGSLKGARRNF